MPLKVIERADSMLKLLEQTHSHEDDMGEQMGKQRASEGQQRKNDNAP